MDGILADGRSGRLWMCRRHEGHALGLVMRVAVCGHFEERLLLFREAVCVYVDETNGTATLPAVGTIGFLEGTMHDIECDVCKAKRTWWMDRGIALRLIGSLYGDVEAGNG